MKDWLRNRNTMEFLGIWERLNNPNFNWGEFALIRTESGLNPFTSSPSMLIYIHTNYELFYINYMVNRFILNYFTLLKIFKHLNYHSYHGIV